MKRYLLVMGVILALFLILFLMVKALGVPFLTDPTPWMKYGGVLAAVVGVGLLIADVVLPVPSSLVMVAHGALFGVVGPMFKGPDSPCHLFRLGKLHTTRHRGPVRHR